MHAETPTHGKKLNMIDKINSQEQASIKFEQKKLPAGVFFCNNFYTFN